MTDRDLSRISVMKPLCLVAGLCAAISIAACGGSAPDASPAGSTGAASAGSSPGSGSGSSAAVPHEKLAALFPVISGFKREAEPKGDTDGGISRVQADYQQEGGGIGGLSVEMMDVSTNSMMLTAFNEIQRNPRTTKTDIGTQKTTTIAGFPAYEEWTPEAGNGSVGVLVADRFLVTVTGSSVGKVDVIYKAMDAIDLKKIAALK
jgi:hypothetical protein